MSGNFKMITLGQWLKQTLKDGVRISPHSIPGYSILRNAKTTTIEWEPVDTHAVVEQGWLPYNSNRSENSETISLQTRNEREPETFIKFAPFIVSRIINFFGYIPLKALEMGGCVYATDLLFVYSPTSMEFWAIQGLAISSVTGAQEYISHRLGEMIGRLPEEFNCDMQEELKVYKSIINRMDAFKKAVIVFLAVFSWHPILEFLRNYVPFLSIDLTQAATVGVCCAIMTIIVCTLFDLIVKAEIAVQKRCRSTNTAFWGQTTSSAEGEHIDFDSYLTKINTEYTVEGLTTQVAMVVGVTISYVFLYNSNYNLFHLKNLQYENVLEIIFATAFGNGLGHIIGTLLKSVPYAIMQLNRKFKLFPQFNEKTFCNIL